MLIRNSRLSGGDLVTCGLVVWLAAFPSIADQVRGDDDSLGGVTIAVTSSAAKRDARAAELADALAALTQLSLQERGRFRLVERQQLDLALQELAWQGRQRLTDAERPRLGALLTADVLVSIRVDPRQCGDSVAHDARLRIVDARGGEIRGLAMSPCQSDSIEDAARQFTDYVEGAMCRPADAGRTVAVAPFDSRGRFDRLRPLELGVRDLLVAALLRRSGITLGMPMTVSPKSAAPKSASPPSSGPRFHVLQRSDLGDLIRELDLMQSGLADGEQLPKSLPTRATSYLVRGMLDERSTGKSWQVVVEGELTSAATQGTVATFRVECDPTELEGRLQSVADDLAARVSNDNPARPASVRGLERFESDSLLARALADTRRLRRFSPIDASLRELPQPADLSPLRAVKTLSASVVEPESPLGRALLQKSVDRFETVLLIRPDSAVASLGLGVCRSFHVEGIQDLVQAEERLRTAFGHDPAGAVGATALAYLAENGFDHRTRQAARGSASSAAERISFAFENMPAQHRDRRWARMLELLPAGSSIEWLDRPNGQRIERWESIANELEPALKDTVASSLTDFVSRLATSPGSPERLRTRMRSKLMDWAQGQDVAWATVAVRRVAALEQQGGRALTAAQWYERGAKLLENRPSPAERQRRANLQLHAARCWREGGEPRRALEVLEAVPPFVETSSLNRGQFGWERGQCLELLDEKLLALEAYVAGAEQCPAIAENSEIVRRIESLGGVPLSKDRRIDVNHVASPEIVRDATEADGGAARRGVATRLGVVLATDGRRLFMPVETSGQSRGKHRLAAYDPTMSQWTVDERALGRVTSMAWCGEQLWVGTRDAGLWRWRGRATGQYEWRHWGRDDGLPDLHVTGVVPCGDSIMAALGDVDGGVVRIDRSDRVVIEESPHAPRTAVGTLAAYDDRITVVCREGSFEYSPDTGKWRRFELGFPARVGETGRVFSGTDGFWGSTYGHELFRIGVPPTGNERFRPTWYPDGMAKAGYLVDWILERNGEIWLGGSSWDSFNSCGLYRFDLSTHRFERFGPRDGFRAGTNRTAAGVWLGHDLWVLNSRGLAQVRRRTED